jgi:hypothetical protein
MKKLVMVLALLAGMLSAARAIDPASATFVSTRGDSAGTYVSTETFFLGTQLLLTNCVLYAGSTTNTARENLTNCTVGLRVGFASTNFAASGTVQDATNGTFWALFTLATNIPNPSLQITVTDAATNSYIYPWKTIKTQSPLQ